MVDYCLLLLDSTSCIQCKFFFRRISFSNWIFCLACDFSIVCSDKRLLAIVKSGWGRDRTVDLTIFSRTLVPTELPSRDGKLESKVATQTGLEPATSAVTGRRANRLRYWALASPTGFEPVLPP